jgi:hypothetical protein
MVSAVCLARNLPLFFRRSPRTPLRALGVVAFDLLHVLRHGTPLPRETARELGWWLDFQGCANAVWDRKPYREAEHATLRAQLERAGLAAFVEDYLDRLRQLEGRRPASGEDAGRFEDVRSYREGVARLAMAAPAALALEQKSIDAGLRATELDRDVATLFRILMQCQIIDDVLDYRSDLAAGLPGFLTACASVQEAIDRTREAARAYGAPRQSGGAVFPLRAALGITTGLTALVIGAARWRYRRGLPARARQA